MGCFSKTPVRAPKCILFPINGPLWLTTSSCDLILEYQNHCPLAKRAWTFQERLLSRRILHFGRSGLFWECNQLATFQHNLTDAHSDADFHLQTRKREVQKSSDASEVIRNWYNLVDNYSSRAVTVESDKLIALSALAKKYQSILKDAYVAGLWRKDLIVGLIWGVNGERGMTRPESYCAPSWSWASIKQGVFFPYSAPPYSSKPVCRCDYLYYILWTNTLIEKLIQSPRCGRRSSRLRSYWTDKIGIYPRPGLPTSIASSANT